MGAIADSARLATMLAVPDMAFRSSIHVRPAILCPADGALQRSSAGLVSQGLVLKCGNRWGDRMDEAVPELDSGWWLTRWRGCAERHRCEQPVVHRYDGSRMCPG